MLDRRIPNFTLCWHLIESDHSWNLISVKWGEHTSKALINSSRCVYGSFSCWQSHFIVSVSMALNLGTSAHCNCIIKEANQTSLVQRTARFTCLNVIGMNKSKWHRVSVMQPLILSIHSLRLLLILSTIVTNLWWCLSIVLLIYSSSYFITSFFLSCTLWVSWNRKCDNNGGSNIHGKGGVWKGKWRAKLVIGAIFITKYILVGKYWEIKYGGYSIETFQFGSRGVWVDLSRAHLSRALSE